MSSAVGSNVGDFDQHAVSRGTARRTVPITGTDIAFPQAATLSKVVSCNANLGSKAFSGKPRSNETNKSASNYKSWEDRL